MSNIFKKTLSFIMAVIVFVSCPLCVYASEHGGGGGSNHGQLTEEEKRLKKLEIVDNIEKYLLFLCSQIGVYFNGSSYSDFYNNYVDYVKSTNDKWFEDNVSVSDDGKAIFSQDLMKSLKEYIEKYAKENEPYTMYRTVPFTSIPYTAFNNQSNVYHSLKNLLADSSSGVVGVSFIWADGKFTFTDIGSHFKDVGFVKYYYDGLGYKAEVKAYDISTWNHATYPRYQLIMSHDDAVIKDKEDFIARATETYTNYSAYIRFICLHDDVSIQSIDRNVISSGNQVANFLVSSDSRRIRVYNTYADFQDYTLGKRSVYYTSNYYDYVPEDFTVSIDDLQKEVDDLSKVIDQLLDQISKDTDESEIEELLKQILEELRNSQGGGGGGSGGGNVTVDMTTTNSLLSKILAKVTQIFDKMNTAVEDAEDAALAKIQESLDEIIVQLKKIKRWTAVDTVIDGVDAIGDWLDLIRDVIKDAKEGTGSAVAAVSSAVSDSTDLMTKKFPFSAPWDLFFLISFFSAEPEVPYFEIPFCIPYYDFEYTFVIDFKDYQWLSDVIRPILLMVYAVGLLSKTPSILSISKEN